MTSLNVEYRDFKHIVLFVIQLAMYISSVGYSFEIVYHRHLEWSLLYSLDPMVGAIDGFRWAMLRGQAEIYLPGFFLSLVIVFLVFASEIWFFRKRNVPLLMLFRGLNSCLIQQFESRN